MPGDPQGRRRQTQAAQLAKQLSSVRSQVRIARSGVDKLAARLAVHEATEHDLLLRLVHAKAEHAVEETRERRLGAELRLRRCERSEAAEAVCAAEQRHRELQGELRAEEERLAAAQALLRSAEVEAVAAGCALEATKQELARDTARLEGVAGALCRLVPLPPPCAFMDPVHIPAEDVPYQWSPPPPPPLPAAESGRVPPLGSIGLSPARINAPLAAATSPPSPLPRPSGEAAALGGPGAGAGHVEASLAPSAGAAEPSDGCGIAASPSATEPAADSSQSGLDALRRAFELAGPGSDGRVSCAALLAALGGGQEGTASKERLSWQDIQDWAEGELRGQQEQQGAQLQRRPPPPSPAAAPQRRGGADEVV
eukprot:TRINITY_DN2414_c5_g2_i1.p2 TRINITY_DN2414_c5_g2~~TRINITY_DN2414_c5_g2_i1.p2  ORF type:complete len:402 (+),score=123.90 TRINITY_DN2414_c5_g2_i1:102-1208(+)